MKSREQTVQKDLQKFDMNLLDRLGEGNNLLIQR